jgi:RNA-binding protein YhbY
MSSTAGSNGILDGRANALKFESWQMQVEDFKPFIRQGTLSISRIADESGLKRNVFYTNTEIRERLLPELIALLEARGLLKARVAMPATVVVRETRGSSVSDAQVKQLTEQNQAYKVEIAELRKEIQRRELIKSMLSETGRMPW